MAAIRGLGVDESGTRPTVDRGDRVPPVAWLIAAVYVVLELAVSGRYGFQQDELYFLVATRHPAFGYVDQPPLAVLLARTTDLLGVNPTAIRILPALAGGTVIVLNARLAALFGGGRAARAIGALAVAVAPIFLGAMHIGNTTPYDLLAWTVVIVCVATALLRGRPHWWLGAGLAAGIGINDEYLMLTLLAAMSLGILLTSTHRNVLATRWPWLGGVIALVIWAPNLAWQFASDWPQLTMAAALHRENDSSADYLTGIPGQLVYAGLLGIPLAIAGMVVLWRSAQLRFLAVGAGWAERWITRARRPRARQVILGALAVVGTLAMLPAVLPVLPVTQLHNVNGATSIADGVGWPQLAADVMAQQRRLSRAGQPPTTIFTGAYAEAGALQLYGAKHQLPPVLSAHNTYWTWGPGTATDTAVLYVDAADQLKPYFASCRQLSVYNPPDAVHNDWNDLPIGVCTGPSASWDVLWPKLKHYD